VDHAAATPFDKSERILQTDFRKAENRRPEIKKIEP
jgi:hypothetical protein